MLGDVKLLTSDEDDIPDDHTYHPYDTYHYDQCEIGHWYQLDHGTDYIRSPVNAQMAAYTYGRRRNLTVRTQRNDRKGWIRVRFDRKHVIDMPQQIIELTQHNHPDKWYKVTLAEHIAHEHPEHIYPKLSVIQQWNIDELRRHHDEMHNLRNSSSIDNANPAS